MLIFFFLEENDSLVIILIFPTEKYHIPNIYPKFSVGTTTAQQFIKASIVNGFLKNRATQVSW